MRLDAQSEQYLLGRATRAELSAEVRDAFAGRRVLITGAGGSVGSELARRLLACEPAEIVLLDHAEYQLFRVTQELAGLVPTAAIRPLLADVSRPEDLAVVFGASRPDFVFHAAAYKHVTIAEECCVAAARTNVLGAVYTARAAASVGARFTLISTDKAAEPHSVMGATKRLAELCILDRQRGAGAIAVRFGNVLASSGSVVEVLMDAALAGRPLTVTDPGATRFFMTASEAASLVLKSAILGSAGDVFWLDMGSPLRLADLVERILDVATPPGAERAPIMVTGLRPGEKRNEELTTIDLAMEATPDPAVWRARQSAADATLAASIEELARACSAGDAVQVLRVLTDAVADYRPSTAARAAARRSTRASNMFNAAVRATRELPARRVS